MDVLCERCATEYELDDDSVPAAGCPVQCTTCGHTFTVQPANKPAIAQNPSPPRADWLLETSDGLLHRFRNLTSLQKWIIERKVTREDKISRTGQSWRRLGEIVELAPFFDVVDEADRARAVQAGVQGQDLKAEAQRARVVGTSRASPVPAVAAEPSAPASRHTNAPLARQNIVDADMAQLDAWTADAPVLAEPGFDDPELTSVVSRRRGAVVACLIVAGLLVTAGIVFMTRQRVANKNLTGVVQQPGVVETQPANPAPAASEPQQQAEPATELPAPSAAAPAPAPLPVANAGSTAQPTTLTPVAPGPSTAATPPAQATGGAGTAAAKAEAAAAAGGPAQAIAEPPASYDKLVIDADHLLENGATERATKLYERALKLQPRGPEALTGLAYAMLDKERVALAVSYFERALAQAPSYGPAMFGLAEALRAEGQETRAIELYRRYMQVNAAGADAPAARRQLRLLEDKLGAAAPTRATDVPQSPSAAEPATPP